VAADAGGQGAPGGNIDVNTAGALSFGASFASTANASTAPADAQRIASLDADVAVTGTAVIDADLTVQGTRRITVSGGDLFIAGKVRSNGDIAIEVPNGALYVTGTIDTSGTNGTRAGDIRITAERDVMLLGVVNGRGGAASATSGDAQGGAAAALVIDAGGNVQLAGIVDLRGGLARGGALAGGAGGHVAIGATRPPASVTFALDVSTDGGDGFAAAGAGGNLTLIVGGDFTVAGTVRSRGGSIAAGGAGDGGLAGNFTMDINTTAGNQTYRPGSVIMVDGGGSGGTGTAGGGGHLYARSFDGIVTMSGSLSARGGAARDPGGTGGLGGHINIFSDNNFDGVGGNLTVTPEGVIDASGGAGTNGGSARNDGTTDVADFPINQEMIAVLLNADGIHGTPTNGVIDNQGVIVVRGGEANGAGGDIAFHGEGTGGLHDPLGGHLEMGGSGTGPEGQFASE
jgi:hypothetical protein